MGTTIDGIYIEIKNLPNKCPRCHFSISAEYKDGCVKNSNFFDLFFKCPNCKRGFIGEYDWGEVKAITPLSYREELFEKEIKEISPAFIEIFNQSLEAESQNLNQLTGIGLRKALEFLIKDFLIYKKPDDEENIKKIQLSRCINNYINDTKLKQISERAVWLGNDETHYIRKWEDKDIKDLKLLIQVTVNMIHNDLLTEKYLSEMEN
ncbi:DUF4145 domain-containing protein [Aliarcobacter butzleri]|uniref:DUF4145 domain-containing protein n=1 Tax=Aliarcobacter butzleri L351 TaxID=1447259 RepID=A0A837J8X0_9BACT|nr:DUF4145 domain-containing protein [Aliarcobacter butzleri]KLE02918.1 hypothetical protein AF76_00870 [Aliarcobacter butzleri L351]MDN5047337.1 DUF4145 domain-containing protein [Aliarcobacter butzleri]MDN5109180.1 DUF4145 domain-containing protein [Aliarcobacter butzleri]